MDEKKNCYKLDELLRPLENEMIGSEPNEYTLKEMAMVLGMRKAINFILSGDEKFLWWTENE